MVTLFTKPGCVQCVATYRKLTTKGVAFETVDISVNEEALEFVKSLGYSQVPVVVVGDRHWSGFDPDRIDALAA